jgi:hypothetical protein
MQFVSPSPHETAHAPIEHTLPMAQALPQAPQFPKSVCVLVHVPVQFVRPIWHDSAHVPPEHTSPAGHA